MSHTKTKTQSFIFLLIAIVIVMSATLIATSILALTKFQKKVLAQTSQQAPKGATIAVMPNQATPESAASSSASPKPSPIPLSGYCINVPILMYHHIQPMDIAKQTGQQSLTVDNVAFDSQMAYIK